MHKTEIFKLKLKLIIILVVVLFFFLFSSELMNSLFNNRLDELGFTLSERIEFTFKPTVVGIYFVFTALLLFGVFRYLSPLFSYLRTKIDYDKARMATVRIHWLIIIFQLVAWTVGTTVYYAIKGWEAESGIPYVLGLLLKLSGGLMGAIFTSLFYNLILNDVKNYLGITSVRSGENDEFSRKKDQICGTVIVFYLVTNLSYFIYYHAHKAEQADPSELTLLLVMAGIFYGGISIAMVLFSKADYKRQIEKLKNELELLATGKSDLSKRIVITNFNELGDMAADISQIIERFHELMTKIQETTTILQESAHNLNDAVQNNVSTSNEQAASVKEVVATMEDSDKLTKQVGSKITEVAAKSVNTKENVEEGFSIIHENLEKMEEVKEANNKTIEEIRTLNDEISGIWEIVKMINSIAGQIRMIAFNAELEASSAGEAGKNFEIVANEIRRLADSTVTSTGQIREKIRSIQQSSDELILSSEKGTDKIQEGWELSSHVERVFTHILESSEEAASFSQDITTSVEQQVHAIEQIVETFKYISEGVNSFADSTNSMAETARNLESSVAQLTTLIEEKGE
jgi:methyl-accepting chemotaxis protein